MFEYLIDSIKSLFGKGKLRFHFVCEDGTTGVAKINYVGDIRTMDLEEMTTHIKGVCWVEFGRKIKSIRYVGHYAS